MLLSKPLVLMSDDEIKDWLRKLLLDQRLESVELDYKEGSIKVDTLGERKEFAADISSFANCRGGILIYGVKEDDRQTKDQKEKVVYPLAFEGAEFDDELLLKAEQVISNGIEPHLPEHPTIKPIRLSLNADEEEKWAIVIEVRRSWVGPHMVTEDKEFRYYSRQNFRKGPARMDHWELTRLFEESLQQTDKVAHWIAGRDTALHIGRANRGLSEPILFMVLVPHVLIDDRLDIGDPELRRYFDNRQYNPYQATFQPSLYGLAAKARDEYEILMHRNLAIENVQKLTQLIGRHAPGNCVSFIEVCFEIIRFVMLGRNLYTRFGYDGPLRLKMDFLQGIGSQGWQEWKFSSVGLPKPWHEPALSIVEDISVLALRTNPQLAVKQVLDRYFHAFGEEGSDAKVIDTVFKELSKNTMFKV